jgi:hypothetical protein
MRYLGSVDGPPISPIRIRIGMLVGPERGSVGAPWVRGGCVEAGNRESEVLLGFREVTVHGTSRSCSIPCGLGT